MYHGVYLHKVYIYILYDILHTHIYIYMHITLKLFTMANLQIGRHSAFCPNARSAKGRSSTCCIPQGRRHCSGHPIFTQSRYKERKMYADSKPFDIWYIYIWLYNYICIVYIHSIVFIIFPAWKRSIFFLTSKWGPMPPETTACVSDAASKASASPAWLLQSRCKVIVHGIFIVLDAWLF